MKTKKAPAKATRKTIHAKPAARAKAPAKKKPAAAKKPARRPAKPTARARDEEHTPNSPCDGHANKELGIKASLPPRLRVVGAAAAGDPWRAAKCLLKLKEQVNAKAPGRSISHDGMVGDDRHRTKDSDHNPWVDGNVVTAYDITNDPGKGCDVNKIAEAIRAAKEPRVKYLIWKRRICSSSISPWVWRKYGGSNPHDKHLHISVKETKAHYDNTAAWPV